MTSYIGYNKAQYLLDGPQNIVLRCPDCGWSRVDFTAKYFINTERWRDACEMCAQVLFPITRGMGPRWEDCDVAWEHQRTADTIRQLKQFDPDVPILKRAPFSTLRDSLGVVDPELAHAAGWIDQPHIAVAARDRSTYGVSRNLTDLGATRKIQAAVQMRQRLQHDNALPDRDHVGTLLAVYRKSLVHLTAVYALTLELQARKDRGGDPKLAELIKRLQSARVQESDRATAPEKRQHIEFVDDPTREFALETVTSLLQACSGFVDDRVGR